MGHTVVAEKMGTGVKSSEVLFQITAPYYCAGLIVRGRFVVDAAPILRWCVGKSRPEVMNYFARKRFSVREIK